MGRLRLPMFGLIKTICMKRNIIIALLFFIGIYVHAQNTFETLISRPDDQKIYTITEDDDGNFIMVGRNQNVDSTFLEGYIIKLDNEGNLEKELTFRKNDNSSCEFFNIHSFNQKLYVLGKQNDYYNYNNFDTTKLWYVKFNPELTMESENSLALPFGKWFSYMNSIIDSDSNIVVTGYTTRNDTNHNGTPIYNNDAFFYKLNLNGDSLKTNFFNSYVPLHFSFDLVEKEDNSKYLAFVSHFTNMFGSSGQMLTLSKDLDSLTIDSIPLFVYDFYSPTYISQNKILICGKRGEEPPNDYALNALSITESSTLVDYNIFKKGTTRDHPAMYNGVSKYEENIYIGGNSNFDYANPYWSSNDSWYHLIKVDEDINPIWEYWYGGDTYYFLYSILATTDGGCIMVGNRYDDQVQQGERDIYVVKVNSEGLMVGTSEEQTAETHEAIVFPNPGTNQLKVRMAIQHTESLFQLYDMNGKQVLQGKISSANGAK